MPGKPSKRQFYEIDNHRDAFLHVMDCARNKEELSVMMIREIHKLLMDRLVHDAGEFKRMRTQY